MSLWWAVGALAVAFAISVQSYCHWYFETYLDHELEGFEIWQACPYCGIEVQSLPPDGVDWCSDCDIVVEGETIERFGIPE